MPGNPLEEFVPSLPSVYKVKFKSKYLSPTERKLRIPSSWFNELINSDGETPEAIVESLEHHLGEHVRASADAWQTMWYYCAELHRGNMSMDNRQITSIKQTWLELCMRVYKLVQDLGWCFIAEDHVIEPRDHDRICWIGEEGDDDQCNYYQYKDHARWGYCHFGEGWIDIDAGEYCYSERNDDYYENDTVANDHDMYWRECCETYVDEDVGQGCDRNPDYNNCCDFDNTFFQNEHTSYLKTSSMNYTFGVEMETCTRREVDPDGLNLKTMEDGSISGIEYVTGVLKGDVGIQQLKNICRALREEDVRVDRSCGVHIHIGNTIFNRRFSIMLLKLCKQIEDDVYAIMPSSRKSNSYCKLLPDSISGMNFHNYRKTLGDFTQGVPINKEYNKKKHHPGGHYNSQRYYWVNLTNCSAATGPETVEFRPHSATIDFDKIYNWLLICMSIVSFAENYQRRIITSEFSSKGHITLQEVLQRGLNKRLYDRVWTYCNDRAKGFENTITTQ